MDQNERNRYITLFKRRSKALTPKTPEIQQSHSELISGCKAILFDVYGTLFISGSGDIGAAKKEVTAEVFTTVLKEAGITLLNPLPEDTPLRYFSLIEEEHRKMKTKGIDFPEVRTEHIWMQFLEQCNTFKLMDVDPKLKTAREISVLFETMINPVWPMPDSLTLLLHFRGHRIPMGIVSNAQFFTPLLFSSLYGKALQDLGFSKDLLFWSYEDGHAKPSTHMYEKAGNVLEEQYNIVPNQTLFIGNDMRNDILPAKKIGFLTALFAGDSRSLRLREEDPLCKNTKPDFIVTGLDQIDAFCRNFF